MTETTDFRVTKIDISRVAQVYSGRPGCQCGCKGNYSTKPHVIRRVVENMFRKAEESGEGVWIDRNGIVWARQDDSPYERGFQYAVYFKGTEHDPEVEAARRAA